VTHATIADERASVTLLDAHPTPDNLRAAVLSGLAARPRSLPPKFFYDERGAQLFERITRLDEYYPTRTELGIMERHVAAMAELIGPRARIIEFGSGSGLKTRILLEHLSEPASYVPVDISREQLVRFALSVAHDFPELEVQPVCADYTTAIPLPDAEHAARTVAFFPGSTIGNFETGEAARFLRRVADLCGPAGGLLIGADLHKDPAVIERAYNDDEGVTAAFNLNILRRANRETGADFDLASFRHHAFYDRGEHRIEMRLVADRASTITVPDNDGALVEFAFRKGDFITTEYSHKYTPEAFAALARGSGWRVRRFWTDDRGWFGIWLLERSEA
jgi:dimethylhistidine N-methyltransferase